MKLESLSREFSPPVLPASVTRGAQMHAKAMRPDGVLGKSSQRTQSTHLR